jgi:GTP cyclohydrolase FolE2
MAIPKASTTSGQIVIDKVGIKDISHPITFIDRDGNKNPKNNQKTPYL